LLRLQWYDEWTAALRTNPVKFFVFAGFYEIAAQFKEPSAVSPLGTSFFITGVRSKKLLISALSLRLKAPLAHSDGTRKEPFTPVYLHLVIRSQPLLTNRRISGIL
jgi:hypothetical protein